MAAAGAFAITPHKVSVCILSVAHASQELINHSNTQDTWGGNYAADNNNFSFVAGKDMHLYSNINSMRCMDKSWEDPNLRFIEIGNSAEDFKTERMTENLRWVGMTDEELHKVRIFLIILVTKVGIELLLSYFPLYI